MENKCECGKLKSEIKSGHYGRCKQYKEKLDKIKNNITYDYLYKSYINDGKSLSYIAKELGLHKTKILENKLIEFNILKRTLQEAKKQNHHIELSKQTSLKKYGVEFHLEKNSPLLIKSKQTINDKYGVDNIMFSNDIIKKKKRVFYRKIWSR